MLINIRLVHQLVLERLNEIEINSYCVPFSVLSGPEGARIAGKRKNGRKAPAPKHLPNASPANLSSLISNQSRISLSHFPSPPGPCSRSCQKNMSDTYQECPLFFAPGFLSAPGGGDGASARLRDELISAAILYNIVIKTVFNAVFDAVFKILMLYGIEAVVFREVPYAERGVS